jgi:hypothetical protein
MGKARPRSSPLNLTLDAGALIALERGDGKMIALLDQAQKRNVGFHVPAGVVGQVWRDGSRQATLARFFRTEAVLVVALDGQLARTCGELCGAAGTSDVIDASVVIVAKLHRGPIITSDADDLKRLDRKAVLIDI